VLKSACINNLELQDEETAVQHGQGSHRGNSSPRGGQKKSCSPNKGEKIKGGHLKKTKD